MRNRATAAVIYGRSSSGKQKSIADQNAENRAAARDAGWTVAEELSDPVSASRYGRKVRENWARIGELLPTIGVVVLWEASRGDRTLSTWIAFVDACREHGVKVHATSHRRTYDPQVARDYRTLAEDGVEATYEVDRLSARVRRGRAARAASGKPASQPAFGYTRVYDATTAEYLREVENPEQAAIVRDIFASFAAGEPINGLAARMHRAGVPTPRPARATAGRLGSTPPVWRSNTVRKILTNQRYAPHPDNPDRGCLVHRRGQPDEAVYVGTWPPLVDDRTWRAVRDRLGLDDQTVRVGRRYSAPGHVKYLLSGSVHLMRTPCGGIVTGSPGRYMCATDHCTSVPMAEADRYVTELLIARLSKRDARRMWVVDDSATKVADWELAQLEQQLAENLEEYLADRLSAKAYAAKEQRLAPLIVDAKRRARPSGAPLAVLELLDAAKVARDNVRPTWDKLTVLARREVVAAVFASLTVAKAAGFPPITRWSLPEERLAIVADRISHEWRTEP